MESGVGAGPLSSAARARLDRVPAGGVEPLRPPDQADRPAVAAWRDRIHRRWLAGDPPPAATGHAEAVVGGIRCLVAGTTRPTDDPAPSAGAPVAVYLHGGGFALGSPEVAIPITERLARGIPVVSVDYRLAPEHPYPAALDDTLTVVDALAHADPDRPLVLIGDSAGANLAVGAALMTPHRGAVAAVVGLSPHLDHGDGPSVGPVGQPRNGSRSHGGDRLGDRDPLSDVDDVAGAWLRTAYCGGVDPADPGPSPLRAELGALARLPPILIQAGTRDSTLTGAIRLARRARRAGVTVTLDVWDGLWHAWHYHRDLPEADRALDEVLAFVEGITARR